MTARLLALSLLAGALSGCLETQAGTGEPRCRMQRAWRFSIPAEGPHARPPKLVNLTMTGQYVSGHRLEGTALGAEGLGYDLTMTLDFGSGSSVFMTGKCDPAGTDFQVLGGTFQERAGSETLEGGAWSARPAQLDGRLSLSGTYAGKDVAFSARPASGELWYEADGIHPKRMTFVAFDGETRLELALAGRDLLVAGEYAAIEGTTFSDQVSATLRIDQGQDPAPGEVAATGGTLVVDDVGATGDRYTGSFSFTLKDGGKASGTFESIRFE